MAHPRPTDAPLLFASVLDDDPDLADALDGSACAARGVATARVVGVKPGECDLAPWFEAVGEGPGLLVLGGLVVARTRVADRVVAELLGPGDLVQLPAADRDDTVLSEASWQALRHGRLAVLDAAFAQRTLPWPQIGHALLRRSERRAGDLRAIRAICAQPRLEVRLVLLLHRLAGRFGRVEPAGLRLTLPLTHRLLGQLAAAERPSISNALGRLARAGIVTGRPGDWHLHGTLDEQLVRLSGSSLPHTIPPG
ncbi:MAG TPA: helix-turn-helix domain-containing protein [Gaiellales bacterium]|nr:helix-turn-helix domain-containing protein [Gaiellales bacterium]